jgi:hypothetical protein
MQALAYWKATTMDNAGLLESALKLLNDNGIGYCVIGGQAVNAYVEPVVSLDLGLAVVAEQLSQAAALFEPGFKVERFEHSINISARGSALRIQLQTDPRYSEFVARAAPKEVLGLTLPVATLEDVLQGKVWAASDQKRRASKRQKDLADIARLLEAYPRLRAQVPHDVLARLVV